LLKRAEEDSVARMLGGRIGLLLFCAAAGCGSSPTTNPSDDGGASNTGGTNFLTITGVDHGKAPITATIRGNQYYQGNGVACSEGTVSSPDLRIDARGPGGGLAPNALVQYFLFDDTQLERDENFSPTPPQVTTFRLDVMAWDGSNLFSFGDPISWKANLPYNPTCHTSFSELDTTAAGTMTCHNLLGGDGQTLKDVTVQFSCVVTTP
jgi:hypothetical protein